MELSGSVAIVTGASRGIGVYLARHLARKGVDLVLAARTEDALEQTAQEVRALGSKVIGMPTDVTRGADREKLVKAALAEFGRIDVLVNNAGMEMIGYFERLDIERVEQAIATNLTGLIALTRLVVPTMVERRRGHVVNIASAAGKTARPYGSVYAATKHGVVGFSWSLRAELAPHGVGVSVVCPGYVSGAGMFADRNAGRPPAALKACTPDDVARAVVKVVEGNRAEVVIGPPIVKTTDLFHALSPSLAMWIGRRSGLYRFLRKEATGD